MSMAQSEWSARVAEIGQMAGWKQEYIALLLRLQEPGMANFYGMESGETNPAVIAAIRQLCADWLRDEGVVAKRVCVWKRSEFSGDWILECKGERGECDAWRPNSMTYCPKCGGKIEVAP